jgi:autoinducer 2-degrading protein
MYVVAVSVRVKPECVDAFKEAILANGRGTRREPGNLRFDINQCIDDPTRFLLYEVYRDEAGFKAHQQTPHYLTWKEAVTDWMAQPRQAVKLESLFPEDEDAW